MTIHCKIVWRNGKTSEMESDDDPIEIDVNKMAARYGTEPMSVSFYLTPLAKRPASEDAIGTVWFYKEGEN